MSVQIPDQMQCPYETAMRRFDNRNALIEDPVQHIQEEKKLRPWMPEEKRVFNEKFLAHPKVRCSPSHSILKLAQKKTSTDSM